MPTAKALNDRIKKDGVYIEKGDANAAATFAKTQGTLSKDTNSTDAVSISKEAMELSKSEKRPNIEFSLTKIGENRFRVGFSNSAMLNRAVKQGFLEIEGKQVELSDDVKKELLASDKEITRRREIIGMKNMMGQMAAQNRQTSDAMAAAFEKAKRNKEDDEEDEKISRENDAARDYENTPKDYSVEPLEMPKLETNMDVSFDGDAAIAGNVGISNVE